MEQSRDVKRTICSVQQYPSVVAIVVECECIDCCAMLRYYCTKLFHCLQERLSLWLLFISDLETAIISVLSFIETFVIIYMISC